MKPRALPRFFCLGWLLLAFGADAQQSVVSFHDGKGQLVKTVAADGTVVEFIYDPQGNLLEIRRTALGAIAILGVSPTQGPAGATVTIQGQGFSATPAANDVRFNGTAATVLSASTSSLVVSVPAGATTGPITVTVAGETATSSQPFTVVDSPVVSNVTPVLAASDAAAPVVLPNVQVLGANLQGSEFTFVPEIAPQPLSIGSAAIDPGGASAALSVTIAAGTTGSFTVLATNGAGSSSAFPSPTNTITVLAGALDPDVDGLTNAQEVLRGTDPFNRDTDGDSFPDGEEVAMNTNPLDPTSTPVTFAFGVISILNLTDPSASTGEFFGAPVSVLNSTAPGGYAGGPDVSVENRPNP